MTENERLKLIIEQLNYKTQKDFAAKLNIQPGSLSDILRGKSGLGISNAIKDKLELFFNVNIEWLLTGKGEMFNESATDNKKEEGVPYYPLDVSNLHEHPEKAFKEEDVEYHVNFKPLNNCNAYVPVYGDSMFPRYASGEIIAIKEIKNLDVIQWGEAYLIITNEHANNFNGIKLLHPHPNPQMLILRSSNPNYKGDTIILKEYIIALYIIKGKISRNMV